jgi:hypothetical protein
MAVPLMLVATTGRSDANWPSAARVTVRLWEMPTTAVVAAHRARRTRICRC